MDPQQTAMYAKAHDDLRDLFHEIARHGRVTALELKHELLPFTAGDAQRDLQELVDDMNRKHTSLDEPEFIRVLWKKMYLANVIYTTQQAGSMARPSSTCGLRAGLSADRSDSEAINVPLAHVIVSIKRRAQMKQFSKYYASRGISGADHLDADKGHTRRVRSTPRHLVQAEKKRHAAAAVAAEAATITALRGRKSFKYDMVVCCYDADAMCMRTQTMLKDVEAASVSNCSRLHCTVSTKDGGVLVVGSRHFISRSRGRAASLVNDQNCDDTQSQPGRPEPGLTNKAAIASSAVKDLCVIKLEDLGLRNIVVFGVGRGIVVATTERRVHCWEVFASNTTPSTELQTDTAAATSQSVENKSVKPSIPIEQIEFLEDEGDCFGHVPLLKRAKVVSDVAGIRQLACGDRFVIGVTAASELYIWGTAPLGRGKTTPTRFPCVNSAEPGQSIVVRRITCGLTHVLLLTSHGRVFTWGSNVHGQLGTGSHGSVLDPTVNEPVEIKLPSLALDVACGDHHSVVLTDKGMLFAWGNNWDGQLGLDPSGSETGCVFAPTKVNWWASREDLRWSRRGDEAFLGGIKKGSQTTVELGPTSPTRNSTTQSPRVYLITAVGDTTAVVSEDGGVYMWGKCVPPGVYAGACGIVSRWRAQNMEVSRSLSEQGQTHDADNLESAIPTSSRWAGIAIASGLLVLSQHADAEQSAPAEASVPLRDQTYLSPKSSHSLRFQKSGH